jgi:hypothetical protein
MMPLPKEKQHRDRAYLDWLRDQPCLFTGYSGCDPMHIGTAGKGLKCHDYWAIPIRHDLHRHIGHQSGEVSMIREYCPDWLLRECLRMYARRIYDDWAALRVTP